jgi:hypothetical protein
MSPDGDDLSFIPKSHRIYNDALDHGNGSVGNSVGGSNQALFLVGASLSLIIYLTESYCAVPSSARMAANDEAMRVLVTFGLIYVTVDFLWKLFKELKNRTKTLREINAGKRPWLILIPFGLFTGVFVAEVYFAISPIIANFCIYE